MSSYLYKSPPSWYHPTQVNLTDYTVTIQPKAGDQVRIKQVLF